MLAFFAPSFFGDCPIKDEVVCLYVTFELILSEVNEPMMTQSEWIKDRLFSLSFLAVTPATPVIILG